MNEEVYLLWVNHWGVYHKQACPDTVAFPSSLYKKYNIPSENFNVVFSRLLAVQRELEEKKIVPTKESYDKIFPKLEDLIK